MKPTVSIVAINYNGKKFLPRFMQSLGELKDVKTETIFIDNDSHDDSVEYVAKHFPHVRVIKNKVNNGYAGAADQGVKESKGEYVMIVNPDIVFEPDYLAVLVKKLEEDRKIGAIIGKLRRYDFEKDKKTSVIDSAGLLMYKNRRCVDRGQAQEDHGQYDRAEEVFGITGACPLYRRSALDDIEIHGEIFDTGFFMYKEDVDVSWRLRLFGWTCFYEPAAVAYHGRGTGIFDRAGAVKVAQNRKNLSPFQKHYSFINERVMRMKNELPLHMLADAFHIIGKELLMVGWMTIREPYLWKSMIQLWKKIPHAMKWRREIMKKKRAGYAEMKKWFQ